jgi:hypothetical protein
MSKSSKANDLLLIGRKNSKEGDDMSRKSSRSHEPSEEELNACEYNMTMAQLKAPGGIFSTLPKSIVLNGKRIPRTALRKRDLCRLYLSRGGKVMSKTRRKLKHYSIPKKPSIEQRKYEKLIQQRSLDHKTSRDKVHSHDTMKSRTSKQKRRASLSPSKHSQSLRRQLNKLKLHANTKDEEPLQEAEILVETESDVSSNDDDGADY